MTLNSKTTPTGEPNPQGIARARYYAVENRRGEIVLIRFIDHSDRESYVRAHAPLAWAVTCVERHGTDGVNYPLDTAGLKL